MHYSSMKNVERTKTEAGLDASHCNVVVDGMKDSKLVNFRHFLMMDYEAES